MIVAVITLEEDAKKKPCVFDASYVPIKCGDLVLVHTAKGYKIGKVITHADVEKGSDVADVINCMISGRRIRKVVVNITRVEEELDRMESMPF